MDRISGLSARLKIEYSTSDGLYEVRNLLLASPSEHLATTTFEMNWISCFPDIRPEVLSLELDIQLVFDFLRF